MNGCFNAYVRGRGVTLKTTEDEPNKDGSREVYRDRANSG